MARFGRKKTSVGLDIGSGLVKVAVIDHSRAEPELIRVAVTPLHADAIVEGEVMDPRIVCDAIRDTLEASGVSATGVITAVGGRDVIIKKIMMERVNAHQAQESIRWEAEQHLPFDMESVTLDFQILDPIGSSPEMSVLLVAAKRELVDARLRVLAEAGVLPAIIDVDAFALHNAFEMSYPEAMRGVVSLVNIGHEVTNINVLAEGVPLLTRDVMVGTRHLREDLQSEHGLTADEAAQLLAGEARSTYLNTVLASRAEEIAVGIERAAAFLASSSLRSPPMHAVYLCGGGSRTPGLADVLAEHLRVHVEHANPLVNLRIRPGALEPLVADEIAPLLMLPIGLALRKPA